jgi:pimeloyl-ACP methyl ester carboxylesterase
MPRLRSLILALLIVLAAFLALTPMARAMLLLRDVQQPLPPPPVLAGVQASSVSFYTSDPNNPIPISGWFVLANPAAPTVILVPSWKQDRLSMLPYARFLVQAHFNTLLIDLRGTGHSGGSVSLGLYEPDDVAAAVSFLDSLTTLTNHHYGVLGVGFGAGVALSAAGETTHALVGAPEIRAVVADSPWATADPTINRLDTLHLFGLAVPLIPTANWAVTQTIGGSPNPVSALIGAQDLQKGQALLLIQSDRNTNPAETPAAIQGLYAAAKTTKATVLPIWNAPLDGPTGIYAAQPAAYTAKVLAFLQSYLVQIKDSPAASPTYVPGYRQ